MNRLLDSRHKTGAALLIGFLVLTVLLSWKLLSHGNAAQAEAANDTAAAPKAAANQPQSDAQGTANAATAQTQPNADGQVLHGVQLPVPVNQLLREVPEGAGGLAVADDDGAVYYTQVNVRDEARLWRRDASGDDQLLWSTDARGRRFEIAGRQGDKLTLIFPDGPLTSAADAWRHSGTFFRLDVLTPGVGVWPDHGNKELKAHFSH